MGADHLISSRFVFDPKRKSGSFSLPEIMGCPTVHGPEDALRRVKSFITLDLVKKIFSGFLT